MHRAIRQPARADRLGDAVGEHGPHHPVGVDDGQFMADGFAPLDGRRRQFDELVVQGAG